MSADSDSVIQSGSVYESRSAALPTGRFFVLEGIDGSGKTSVADRLGEALAYRTGREAVITQEPTSSWLGEVARRSSTERLDPLIETFLFLADRVGHNDQIRRWVEAGLIVICDRYNGSTIAYQGVALRSMMGDPVEWLRSVSQPAVIQPNLTLLLDLPPEESLARLVDREARTKFESVRYLGEVREIYLQLAEEEGWQVIDASLPLDSVVEVAVSSILRNL